jgi:hypothetical protein
MRDLPRLDEEKFARLPKWAQTHIQVLRRDLLRAYEEQARGPEDSIVFADPYGKELPLGDDVIRIFPHADQPDKWADIRVHEHQGRHGITVMSDYHMLISPQSSNVVVIDVRDHRFVKGDRV